jgi:hypothetical protein
LNHKPLGVYKSSFGIGWNAGPAYGMINADRQVLNLLKDRPHGQAVSVETLPEILPTGGGQWHCIVSGGGGGRGLG